MRIGQNEYLCGFCGHIEFQEVRSIKGAGKKGAATSQVKCKCGNYISQKKPGELK